MSSMFAVVQKIRCQACGEDVSLPVFPEALSVDELMGEILKTTEGHKAVCQGSAQIGSTLPEEAVS